MTADGLPPPPATDGGRHPLTAPSAPPPPPPPGLIARSSKTLRPPVLIAPAEPAVPPVSASAVRPVQPIANTAQGLIGITIVFGLFSVFVPEGREPAQFVQFANGMNVLFFAMAIAAVVVWLYRIAAGVRAAGRRTRWSPLWAVFGWVLPPNLFVIPSFQLSELWKATGAAVTSSDRESWRNESTNRWIWTWSGLFFLSYLLLLPYNFSLVTEYLSSIDWQHPENRPVIDSAPLTGGFWVLSVLSTIVMALAGVALIVVIHQLSRRYDEFADRQTV